jgi:Rps23 Pro-64 3,4-dihydroxylase Tpa1-like proline 4-hydroxylase
MLQDQPGRKEIADHIAACLQENLSAMREAFASPGRVPSCSVDNLLPDSLARRIFDNFPPVGRMMFRNSIKERKYVSAQMNEHPPILEETVFAFQDPRVLQLIAAITGLDALEPDTNLYAGGISAMSNGNYLKPHLDNSHDRVGSRYRVLNLLYYVSPDWREEYGGNLELWDQGPKGEPRTIPSLFNRLVLMMTNKTSWHSVSEVQHEGVRCCVSNYYFSQVSPEESAYFHATSFRGRPNETVADAIMAADNALRTGILKTFGSKAYRNPHVYKRPDDK